MTSTMQNVLITGGAGFVGAHIVQRLIDTETAAIHVVSRNPKKRFHHSRVFYHAADISDQAKVQALFEKVQPQVVIHTASPDPLESDAAHQRTNVQGTKVLLDCAKNCSSTSVFVYTSSDSACYPTGSQPTPATEDQVKLWDEKHYNNPYGKSKAIADNLVRAANSAELRTVVLSIPVVYGEDADERNMVPQLMESLKKGEHKMQVGDNKPFFEFCYVENVVEAHMLAVKALFGSHGGATSETKVDGEAFFITDGVSRKFFDFARDCYAVAGAPVAEDEIKIIPLWLLQSMASVGEWAYWIFTLGYLKPKMRRQNIDHLGGGAHWSIEKAKQRLGYRPVVEQKEAIERTTKWAMKAAGMKKRSSPSE